MDGEELVFPEKPERPEESDCCGSGCSPCVFDVYEGNVKKWEERCREIRENPASKVRRDVRRESYLSETRYKPFRVKSVESHTYNTKMFAFQAVDEETSTAALGLMPGQNVIMKGRTNEGANVSRAYTPITDRPGEFDMLVKLYPDGVMSRYLATLTPGDVAHFRGPYGGFRRRANEHRRVLMLCAGTGLAPAYSVARAIVDDERDETFVRLLFCVRTVGDILLRDRLRALAENWNFTARIHVSRGDGPVDRSAARYGEDIRYGRLDVDTLAGELGGGVCGVLVLVCGTKTFNTDMTENALALGVNKSNIYVF